MHGRAALGVGAGAENVRVDDIAEAAAVLARSSDVSLSAAVIDAVVDQYTDPGDQARDVFLMITTSTALRSSYADSARMIEGPLADALIERSEAIDRLTARVLAAGVGAAVEVALRQWLQPTTRASTTRAPANGGLVVPSGSLPDLMRAAFDPARAGARRSREPPGPATTPAPVVRDEKASLTPPTTSARPSRTPRRRRFPSQEDHT